MRLLQTKLCPEGQSKELERPEGHPAPKKKRTRGQVPRQGSPKERIGASRPGHRVLAVGDIGGINFSLGALALRCNDSPLL